MQATTGTFLDRHLETDLRIVSYNVYWNTIFADASPEQAAKFARVVQALDPDILNLQEVTRSASQVQSLMNLIAPLPNGNTWHVRQGNDNHIVSKYPFAADPLTGGGEVVALVDLPDAFFPTDFFISNNHYKCCGGIGGPEDQSRQNQSDSIMSWIRDYRTPGGNRDLPPGTPFAVLGDLNIVGGPGPLNTLITGDIANESRYGPDFSPDWDDSFLTDAHPYHNDAQEFDYTWRDDQQIFDPGILDFIIYSDSALNVANKFVLNTVSMTPEELSGTGLETFDITLDNVGSIYDHLPVVVDFRIFEFAESDFNFSRGVDGADLMIWQNSYGISAGASRNGGDADGDGDVDGRDFLVWQRQIVPAGFLFTVPEPATIFLSLYAVLLINRRMRRIQGKPIKWVEHESPEPSCRRGA